MSAPDTGFLLSLGLTALVLYASAFCLAWNFYFPTRTEQMLWRACSVYHGFYTVLAGIHYGISTLDHFQKTKDGASTSKALQEHPMGLEMVAGHDVEGHHPAGKKSPRKGHLGRLYIPQWVAGLRNLSTDQDPDVQSSLGGLLPWTLGGVLFCFCRGYLYVEDFISLRAQPADVYVTVDIFLPFVGG